MAYESHDNLLQSNHSNTIALPLFYFWLAWESVHGLKGNKKPCQKPRDNLFLDFTPFLLSPSSPGGLGVMHTYEGNKIYFNNIIVYCSKIIVNRLLPI